MRLEVTLEWDLVGQTPSIASAVQSSQQPALKRVTIRAVSPSPVYKMLFNGPSVSSKTHG